MDEHGNRSKLVAIPPAVMDRVAEHRRITGG